MPAQDRNRKPSALIDHHDGRVEGFIFKMRSNRSHRDAGGADENKCLRLPKIPLRPLGDLYPAVRRAAEGLREQLRERLAAVRERDQTDIHLDASRNSVLKAGSYSLLRS